MRRLVINEAKSQPRVARSYLQGSWDRNIDGLSEVLDGLRQRGALNIESPRVAAEEFTWLLVGGPLNSALLGVAPEVDGRSARTVAIFLARYGIGRV